MVTLTTKILFINLQHKKYGFHLPYVIHLSFLIYLFICHLGTTTLSLLFSGSALFFFFSNDLPQANPMGIYSYSQPSSSPPRSINSEEFRDCSGFITCCWCGGCVTLQTSAGPSNRGRLHYLCENSASGGLHASKWWDEAVVEEIAALKANVSEQEDRLAYFTHGQNGEDIHPTMLLSTISRIEEDIQLIKQQVSDFALAYRLFLDDYKRTRGRNKVYIVVFVVVTMCALSAARFM